MERQWDVQFCGLLEGHYICVIMEMVVCAVNAHRIVFVFQLYLCFSCLCVLVDKNVLKTMGQSQMCLQYVEILLANIHCY